MNALKRDGYRGLPALSEADYSLAVKKHGDAPAMADTMRLPAGHG